VRSAEEERRDRAQHERRDQDRDDDERHGGRQPGAQRLDERGPAAEARGREAEREAGHVGGREARGDGRVGGEGERLPLHHAVCDEGRDQGDQRHGDRREPAGTAPGPHGRDEPQHEHGGDERGGGRADGGHQDPRHGGRGPRAGRAQHREREPREEQVREHGRQAALAERDEQGGRERPDQGGQRAQPGVAGQLRRAQPGGERRERQGGHEEAEHRERRLPRGDAAEHGEHVGERVGGGDGSGAGSAHADPDLRPQRAGARAERQQLAADECGAGEPRQPHDGGEEERGEHGPAAAGGEELHAVGDAHVLDAVLLAGQRPPATADRERLAEGGDARPRRRPGRGEPATAGADPPGRHGHAHRGADLPGSGRRALAEHLEQRAQDGEGHEREPVERDGGRRRVGEAAVQLGLPTQATTATPRRALPEEGGAGGGVARGGDAGGGDDHDAVAGEAGADAEVERVVDGGERVVEAAQLVPEAVAHEHAARGDAEDVAHLVVLRLVELDVDDRHGRAERGERGPHLVDVARVLPLHELRAGDRDARRGLDGGEQALERVGRGRVVGREQPEQLVVALGRGDHADGLVDGLPEGHARGGLHHARWVGRGEEGGGSVTRAEVDRDDLVGPPGLRGEGREGPVEERRALVGDEDRGYSWLHDRGDPTWCVVGIRRSRTARRKPGAAGGTAGSDRALAELAALALGEAAPDAEALVVLERVLEALAAHLARSADLLGVAGGAALLGEERLRVGLRAERVRLPRERVAVVDAADARDPESHGVDEPVVGDSGVVLR
jgi:hypothetical protein